MELLGILVWETEIGEKASVHLYRPISRGQQHGADAVAAIAVHHSGAVIRASLAGYAAG